MDKVLTSESRRRRGRGQVPRPPWASLPEEILDLILNHLILLADYLSFCAVCKPWLSAALLQKERRRKEVLPMLLTPPLPPTPKEKEEEVQEDRHLWRGLYSVTSNKLLKLKLKVPYTRRLCGSSYGLLGTVTEELGVTLINPFSGKSIHFPPVLFHRGPLIDKYDLYECHVLKVVCSCDPPITMSNGHDDFVVGAIGGLDHKFGYIKPGHRVWIWMDLNGCVDAVYHLGKFYVLDSRCGVISVDVSSSSSSCSSSSSSSSSGSGSGSTTPQVQVVVPPTPVCTCRAYIVVKSSSGDDGELLLVQQFHYPRGNRTRGFKIFKLLLGLGGHEQQFAKLVEIHNLGDDALFLGTNQSICVSASKYPGCRPNCIYYFEDCWDTNIYCLEDGSFTPLKGINTRLRRANTPPIWILPRLL